MHGRRYRDADCLENLFHPLPVAAPFSLVSPKTTSGATEYCQFPTVPSPSRGGVTSRCELSRLPTVIIYCSAPISIAIAELLLLASLSRQGADVEIKRRTTILVHSLCPTIGWRTVVTLSNKFSYNKRKYQGSVYFENQQNGTPEMIFRNARKFNKAITNTSLLDFDLSRTKKGERDSESKTTFCGLIYFSDERWIFPFP